MHFFRRGACAAYPVHRGGACLDVARPVLWVHFVRPYSWRPTEPAFWPKKLKPNSTTFWTFGSGAKQAAAIGAEVCNRLWHEPSADEVAEVVLSRDTKKRLRDRALQAGRMGAEIPCMRGGGAGGERAGARAHTIVVTAPEHPWLRCFILLGHMTRCREEYRRSP